MRERKDSHNPRLLSGSQSGMQASQHEIGSIERFHHFLAFLRLEGSS